MPNISYLAKLQAQGFDLAKHIPFTKRYRIRCSQCEAAAINGVACHETGCPNVVQKEEEE